MIRSLNKFLYLPVIAALIPIPVMAFENLSTTLSSDQQACYSLAMVGLDSVINSRLGVPPEHVVGLASESQSMNVSSEAYDHNLLNVILNAYLWKETPHSYAIKVFYQCAQKKGSIINKQAKYE